jgi:hypothetical protein
MMKGTAVVNILTFSYIGITNSDFRLDTF